MIKVYSTDSIIDVVNKINSSEDEELMLEFPLGHSILHNYMSLKILKNKAGNKRLTIITNDLISKNIGTPIGINYSMIKDLDFLKEQSTNQEILKHNFTFFEYFIFEIRKYFKKFINFLGKKTGVGVFKYYNPYNKIRKSGVFILFLGLIMSFGMLVFIFYFAVSKTYIEIEPEINIKTRAINITYEESNKEFDYNSKELKIPIKKISQNIDLSTTYKTTGIDYESTHRSIGEVTFINELKSEQIFKPKTRLLGANGLIFETDDWVKLPPKNYNGSGVLVNGTVTAKITAKIQDINGVFIGKRGNIENAIFSIPGLKFNQDKIYAKLNGKTTGGDNNINYIVSEDDLKNANSILEEMLKKDALSKIKEKIEEDNKLSGVKYEILGVKDIIKYSNININTLKNIKVNDKIDKFDLHGNLTVETYIYNKNSVLNILRNIINDSLLTGTDKLIYIDDNSLRLTVILQRMEKPLKIKATTEVDIGISFDFDNNSNFYNQKLKTMILGIDNNEAKNILLNDAKVRNVIIKNTPFFLKKVSSNIDNIIMKIKE